METTEGIKPRVQEKASPEVNRVTSLDGFFHFLGQVTAKSMSDRREGIKRSLQLRHSRAELFKKFKETPKDDEETRRQLIREGKIRDELERQYLNQGEVTVNLPDLGPQTARYTLIDLPPDLKPSDATEKPPIYFIPGISNDLDCVKSTLQELAYTGRKVVAVGFPESFMGKVTPEFANAAQQSSDYQPHVAFFKEAESKLIGEANEVDLWGHSTGAAIIEQMLSDPKFQQKTREAVLLCPASSSNISKVGMGAGLIKETSHLLRRFGSLPKYSLTQGSKNSQIEGQKELKKRVFNTLMERVRTKMDFIGSAKVKEGGRIVVVSGSQDHLTESSRAKADFLANPQVAFIELPDGHHATPVTNPSLVIAKVNQIR